MKFSSFKLKISEIHQFFNFPPRKPYPPRKCIKNSNLLNFRTNKPFNGAAETISSESNWNNSSIDNQMPNYWFLNFLTFFPIFSYAKTVSGPIISVIIYQFFESFFFQISENFSSKIKKFTFFKTSLVFFQNFFIFKKSKK